MLSSYMGKWDIWVDRCAQLLRLNQISSYGFRYTRPAPHVYEYQWLWDSCFHAMTYRWFDVQMAQDELISLVGGQVTQDLDAGMIPHMIYWQGGGKDLWGEEHRSIITQPPLIAIAAHLVFEKSGDVAFLRKIYSAVVDFHNWLDLRRDVDDDHLVSLIHPWESGWDASPRWDWSMGLINPTHDEAKKARHDLAIVLREHQCDVQSLKSAGYFCVEALDFNSIRAADLEALADIALVLGQVDEAGQHQERARQIQQAINGQMFSDGQYVDLLGPDDQPSSKESAAQFITLFGGCVSEQQADQLVQRLKSSDYWCAYPVPTSPISDPNFDGSQYWRGNVWLAVNWLIYRGLRRYGYDDLATQLVERSLALVERAGFHEYFNPLTGEGYGPDQQSWSAIVLDMLGTEMT